MGARDCRGAGEVKEEVSVKVKDYGDSHLSFVLLLLRWKRDWVYLLVGKVVSLPAIDDWLN